MDEIIPTAMNKNQTFETLPFYRGFSNTRKPSTPLILKTRKDRVPLHMPKDLHSAANDWFNRKFGIQYRSQALFLTGSKFIAQNYAKDNGYVARILPLGAYRFCWSAKNSDLLFLRTKPDNVTVESYLEDSMYQEDELGAAQASSHELMLYCDTYVAIPIDLLEDEGTKVLSGLLLP